MKRAFLTYYYSNGMAQNAGESSQNKCNTGPQPIDWSQAALEWSRRKRSSRSSPANRFKNAHEFSQRRGVGHANRKHKRGRFDLMFGRFKCKICGRMWESASVHSVIGTKKVLYKQRCKKCTGQDAWCFPYDLELNKCGSCQKPATECACACIKCGGLRHRPRGSRDRGQFTDDRWYCRCDRQNFKPNALGMKINCRRHHEASLCGRCIAGKPCSAINNVYYDGDEDGSRGGGGDGGGSSGSGIVDWSQLYMHYLPPTWIVVDDIEKENNDDDGDDDDDDDDDCDYGEEGDNINGLGSYNSGGMGNWVTWHH